MSTKDELLGAVTTMQSANLNALLVLVQTLEEAGLIQEGHYSGNLRMHADLWSKQIGAAATMLLKELADRIDDRVEGGTA